MHILCLFSENHSYLHQCSSEKHFTPQQNGPYYRRIGQAIEVYSDLILDESVAYDEAASSEEERSSSIRKILSRIVNLNNADTNMIASDGDEDSAIQW